MRKLFCNGVSILDSFFVVPRAPRVCRPLVGWKGFCDCARPGVLVRFNLFHHGLRWGKDAAYYWAVKTSGTQGPMLPCVSHMFSCLFFWWPLVAAKVGWWGTWCSNCWSWVEGVDRLGPWKWVVIFCVGSALTMMSCIKWCRASCQGKSRSKQAWLAIFWFSRGRYCLGPGRAEDPEGSPEAQSFPEGENQCVVGWQVCWFCLPTSDPSGYCDFEEDLQMWQKIQGAGSNSWCQQPCNPENANFACQLPSYGWAHEQKLGLCGVRLPVAPKLNLKVARVWDGCSCFSIVSDSVNGWQFPGLECFSWCEPETRQWCHTVHRVASPQELGLHPPLPQPDPCGTHFEGSFVKFFQGRLVKLCSLPDIIPCQFLFSLARLLLSNDLRFEAGFHPWDHSAGLSENASSFTWSLWSLCKDLANTIRYSLKYKEAIRLRGLKPGRYLSVQAGEYFSGLPLGWTSPYAGAVSPHDMRAWLDSQKAGFSQCYLKLFHQVSWCF